MYQPQIACQWNPSLHVSGKYVTIWLDFHLTPCRRVNVHNKGSVGIIALSLESWAWHGESTQVSVTTLGQWSTPLLTTAPSWALVTGQYKQCARPITLQYPSYSSHMQHGVTVSQRGEGMLKSVTNTQLSRERASQECFLGCPPTETLTSRNSGTRSQLSTMLSHLSSRIQSR